jgi:hypothetical protein
VTLFLGLLVIWLVVSGLPVQPPIKYITGVVIVCIVLIVILLPVVGGEGLYRGPLLR